MKQEERKSVKIAVTVYFSSRTIFIQIFRLLFRFDITANHSISSKGIYGILNFRFQYFFIFLQKYSVESIEK